MTGFMFQLIIFAVVTGASCWGWRDLKATADIRRARRTVEDGDRKRPE